MPATDLSLLDEVKLQAQVILPVLRSLRAEIGKDTADRIVGDAMRKWARDLYHRIGDGKTDTPRQPELGGILLRDSDFHIAEVGGANVEFQRTQTIMQGAACCDFRYRFK